MPRQLGEVIENIRFGRPAEVIILTRKRTGLAYLFLAALWRSGKEQ